MADPIIWPMDILKPQSISVDIAHRNLRGPSASNGFTQVVSNSAGIWRVSYSDIPVYTANMIKLWRALDTLTEGQLNSIALPVWDHPRSPGSTDELGSNISNLHRLSTQHSDSSEYGDDSGYESGWTNVLAASTAAFGTVTLNVIKYAPLVELEPGHRFSINDRLYQIQRVISQSNNAASIIVRPPFRDNVGIGDRLEFDNPRVRVRLTSDTAMYLPLSFNRQSFPPLEFIEDV